MDRRELDRLEKMVNPPAVIGPGTVVLSPPLGSVQDYMDYLKAHAEDYRRLFRGEEGRV